ncbi:MAG TPA: PAS domain-containing protein [Polyangiales bacterium]
MSQMQWLERAVDALDVALLLVNAERRVVYANAAAYRLFGMTAGSPEGLMGASIERLVVPERRGELRNFEDVLRGGGARRVRTVLRREDGARVDVTMALEPCFDDQARVSGVSVRYGDAPKHSMRPSLASPRPPLGMGMPSPIPSQAPPAVPAAAATPRLPTPPAPRSESLRSESRLTPARAPNEMLRSRLAKVLQNLEWLEERLSIPASVAPLDETRERARTMLMVEEARGLVNESLTMLDAEEQIPPAPRIPRL